MRENQTLLYGPLLIALSLSILFWHVGSRESKPPVKAAENRLEVAKTSDRDRADDATDGRRVASRAGSSTELGSPGNAAMSSPRYVPLGDLSRRRQTAAQEYGIGGRVSKSETGAPVSGATVTCYRNRTPFGFDQPVKTVSTGQTGRYHLKLPGPMLCKMLVEAGGLAAVEAWAPVHLSSFKKQNFSLSPAESGISGVVVDARGQPVEGARVAPYYAFSFTDGAVASLPTRTDIDGRFELPDLPSGKTGVGVHTSGFLPVFEQVALAPGRILSVRIALQLALTARILVLNENEPISQASINCSTESYRRSINTNERGYGDIELPPGTVSILCNATALGFLRTSFDLDPKLPLTQVRMEEAPIVLGQILSGSGRPIPRASITGGQELATSPKTSTSVLIPRA